MHKIQKFKSPLLVFRRKIYKGGNEKKNTREKMVKVSVNQKTDPNQSKGMEVFLDSSPNPPQKTNPAKKEQQPKEEVQTNTNSEKMKVKTLQPSVNNSQSHFEEVERTVKELERIAKKEIEFSKFNEIVHEKKLMFKLLFITNRIYVRVKDKNEGKETVISIIPPKWGGSSLRYLINNCVSDWCMTTERTMAKGKILTYQPVSISVTTSPEDDIFE